MLLLLSCFLDLQNIDTKTSKLEENNAKIKRDLEKDAKPDEYENNNYEGQHEYPHKNQETYFTEVDIFSRGREYLSTCNKG